MEEITNKFLKLEIKDKMEVPHGLKVPVPEAFKPGMKRDTEAATVFIRRIEMYFKVKEVPEERWSTVIALYLDGTALKWYDFIMSTYMEPPSWDNFREAFLRTYTSRDHEKKTLIRYESLKQLGTVSRYNELFLSCLQTLGREYTTQAGELMHYLLGLKPEVRRHVTAYNPISLDQAMTLALDADERTFNVWGRAWEGSHTNQNFVRKDPNAMDVDEINTRGYEKRNGKHTASFTCFNCGKPGHIARNCPKNVPGRY